MNPSFVVLLILISFVTLCSMAHFYYVSRVLDRFYEQEIKPDREKLESLDGRLRELEVN